MPKTIDECIETVENQIKLALDGLGGEAGFLTMVLEENTPIDEKRSQVVSVRKAAEAIEDLFEQLDDMRIEKEFIESQRNSNT